MSYRIRLEEFTGAETSRLPLERLLGQRLRIDLLGVKALLQSYPTTLPLAGGEGDSLEFKRELEEHGLSCRLVEVPAGALSFCSRHPHLLESKQCIDCASSLCIVCVRNGSGICESCFGNNTRKKKFQRLRILVLTLVLFFVLLLAWKEWRRRNLGWDTPQRVAVVLLTPPNTQLSEELVELFKERHHDVESAMTGARRSYLSSAGAPLQFSLFGPTAEQGTLPRGSPSGPLELLRFNLALEDYADAQDVLVGLKSRNFDARIYLRLRESDGQLEAAEGLGQEGGTIGAVSTEISPSGIDFAWFVVLHEFFHTRGASDKYDEEGRTRVPEGLGEPERIPMYPQETIEIMARGRPISPQEEDIPGEPKSWVVGAWTAREIGWFTDQSR